MKFLSIALIALAIITGSSFGQAPLRPNDSFEMQLGGMPVEFAQDFRTQYTVAEDGTVNVPLIGSVKAAGLTIAQLSRAIERKFVSDQIFTKPTVNLILPAQSRFVTIGGAVRMPSAIPWSADLTLSAAIKRAGGLSEFGSKKKIRVIRDGQTGVFNLDNLARDPSQNPRLLPGDEVEVPGD